MVDAIGREPVLLLDVELQVLERFSSHVVESEFAVIALGKIANGAHQTHPSPSLEREEKNEVRIFDIDVEIIVHGLARSFYISDIEESGICAARKSYTQLTANRRSSAVAAAEKSCIADFLRAVGQPQHRRHAGVALREPQQLRLPLNPHPKVGQFPD